ncbi:MAG: electron transfer flavoprotein subunit beta/FixA family protein [Acidobacteriota bacterium]|nr:electron transfer flavoprotein subunit beta/FixA family protein [Blastocatellia bacterium]MDW8412962.1 electron transfer flavoprotein subunit beta/FixA family protein [Acidobacteriota bacterium]
MKILVCVKQVPSRDAILRLNETSQWIQERDIAYEVNEPDAYAVEEALRIKEKLGGEVVILSMGPERAQITIKDALAKGATRAIHICDPKLEHLDPLTQCRVMAEAIRREGFDLLFTGLQSDDNGFGQTGVILGELLGVPSATIAMAVEIQPDGKTVKVKRELESGWFQWYELPLPASITIQSGLNQPRYATLKGIMEAKKKPIQKLSAANLGFDEAALTPKQHVEKVYFPVKNKKTEIIEGSAKEAAAKLAAKLKEARALV